MKSCRWGIAMVPALIVMWMTFNGRTVAGQVRPQTVSPVLIPSAQSCIQRDFETGKIALDTWATYQAYALFDQARLPVEYQTDGIDRCGSWLLESIQESWGSLAEPTKTLLQGYGFTAAGILSRPTGLNETRTTTHFVIHYSVAPGDTNAISVLDADGNGTPDYVDTVASIVEEVWNQEIVSMGYTPPPPDGLEGGNALYDVYIFKMNPTYYGYTEPENLVGDNPNSDGTVELYAWSSYLNLRNDYSGFSVTGSRALKVTMAHEFFHAIQLGYDRYQRSWLQEATATWIEDEVYDSINDNLNYLPKWFAQPWIPLDAGNWASDASRWYPGHWYGSWIFFRYLSEHLPWRSLSILRLWQHSVEHDSKAADYSFACIDQTLQEQQETFPRIFTAFAEANLLLTRGQYTYREGTLYPHVAESEMVNDTTIIDSLPRHAARFVKIPGSMIPTACNAALAITVTPLDPAIHYELECLTYKGGYPAITPFRSTIKISSSAADSAEFIVMNVDSTGTMPTLFAVAVEHRQHSAHYAVTDIGPVNWAGVALKINNRSQVAGTWFGVGGINPTAFLWDQGSVQYLAGPGSAATGVNDSGDVVGWIRSPIGGVNDSRAHLWSKAGNKDLDTASNDRSQAYGINNAGEIVGRVSNAAEVWPRNLYQPVAWTNGQMQNLASLQDTGWTSGVAYDVNQLGQIVGQIGSSGFNDGVLWNGGSPQDFGPNFWPTAINAQGHCVGTMGAMVDIDGQLTGQPHASLDGADVGTIDGLPGFSAAYGINSAGDIVGSSISSESKGGAAFLMHGGAVIDLNETLDDATCQWFLGAAEGINDKGQIVAYAATTADPAVTHAVLLTPIAATAVAQGHLSRPELFSLEQNYPNPFNPTTEIDYSVPGTGHVTLAVYDLLGREVAILVNEQKAPGRYGVKFNAAGRASGVYVYQLKAGQHVSARKMILLK